MGEHHEEQADEDQVEHEPGDQESTPPGAQPVRRQAVTGIEYGTEHEPGNQKSTLPGAQPVRRQAVTGIKVSRKLPLKSFAIIFGYLTDPPSQRLFRCFTYGNCTLFMVMWKTAKPAEICVRIY